METDGTHDGFGGLAGENWGTILASYATGNVRGIDGVGGLAGWNYAAQNGDVHVIASYATGSVSGERNVGGLAGLMTPQEGGTAYITASYASGSVSGSENVGGLVGIVSRGGGREDLPGGIITSSYWGHPNLLVKQPESGTETSRESKRRPPRSCSRPRDTPASTAPGMGDLDNADGDDNPATGVDDFWDFGTSSQYPALKADLDRDSTATWQEFGSQRGDIPTYTPPEAPAGLTAMEPEPTQITLSWTAPSDNGGAPITAIRSATHRNRSRRQVRCQLDCEGKTCGPRVRVPCSTPSPD